MVRYEEPRQARVKQLRTRVVPPTLRQVVVAACHASPFAGHSGNTRTLQRVITRYWWPMVARDVERMVSACGHCRLANNASHEAQMELHGLESSAPFDVVFLDVWEPGEVVDADGSRKILTCLDCMTGFAAAVALGKDIVATTLAGKAFAAFFVPYGLPKLIVVDAVHQFGSLFKEVFAWLLIPVHSVAPENHKAIRNERFHQYLNKVQKINMADKGSFHQWIQGVMFALYGWNAAPIDGMDVSWSFVAVGREFPFPIDMSSETEAREALMEG